MVVRFLYKGIMSSGRGLPSAAARARASCGLSNTESCRNWRTLCIVMREVGEEEMMMMGYMLPGRALCEHQEESATSGDTYELSLLAAWDLMFQGQDCALSRLIYGTYLVFVPQRRVRSCLCLSTS